MFQNGSELTEANDQGQSSRLREQIKRKNEEEVEKELAWFAFYSL